MGLGLYNASLSWSWSTSFFRFFRFTEFSLYLITKQTLTIEYHSTLCVCVCLPESRIAKKKFFWKIFKEKTQCVYIFRLSIDIWIVNNDCLDFFFLKQNEKQANEIERKQDKNLCFCFRFHFFPTCTKPNWSKLYFICFVSETKLNEWNENIVDRIGISVSFFCSGYFYFYFPVGLQNSFFFLQKTSFVSI